MNPLLPQELVQNIPVEFAPLLISGYNIPIHFFESPFVLEEKVDSFLDKNPHYIEGRNGEMIQIIQKD